MDDLTTSRNGRARKVLGWYGPVILGGILYFIGANASYFIERMHKAPAAETIVSGVGIVKLAMKADRAKLKMTAVANLASTASEAASLVGGNVDRYAEFLKSQKGVTFTNEPAQIQQTTLEVGGRYARSYEARQDFEIVVEDLSKTDLLVSEAVKLGFDVGKAELTCSDAAKYRTDARKKAFAIARTHAEEKAALLGKKIDALTNFSEQEDPFLNETDEQNAAIQDLGNEPTSHSPQIYLKHLAELSFTAK